LRSISINQFSKFFWIILSAQVAFGCTAHFPTAHPIPITYPVESEKGGGIFEQYATLYVPHETYQNQIKHRYPTVIILHGGFWGDDKETNRIAAHLVSQGFLVALPAYRGEKRYLDKAQGPGRVEFCAGEVADVRGLLEWLRHHPNVDSARIGIMGFSHGACIALRVATLESTLAAVVSVSAPTNAAKTYQHLRSHPFNDFGFAGWLATQLRSDVGFDPNENFYEWMQRSPVWSAARMVAPLLIVHGASDELVPVSEACNLRDALSQDGRTIREKFMSRIGRFTFINGSVCRPINFSPSPMTLMDLHLQLEWSAIDVWYFEKQGHIFSTSAKKVLEFGVTQFLREHLLGD